MISRIPFGSTSRIGAGRPCDGEDGADDAVPVAHPAVVRRTIASAQTRLRPLGVGVMALHGIRAMMRPQGSRFRGRLSIPPPAACRAERPRGYRKQEG